MKELIDEAQKEYERQQARKGLVLGKKKRIKIFGVKLKDDDYVPEDEQPDESEEEKQAEVPKKGRKQRKTKMWYRKKYRALGDKVLKQQNRLDNVEGETLDRLIRDMQSDIQEGQQLAKEIRSKKYKKIDLNLDFFDQ